MQVIDAGDGLAIERDDDIPLAKSGLLSRAAIGNGNDHNTTFFRQIVEANQTAVKHRGLSFDADVATANSAFAKQPPSHKLCGIDSDGKTEPLRTQDGSCVHSDDLSVGSHQG